MGRPGTCNQPRSEPRTYHDNLGLPVTYYPDCGGTVQAAYVRQYGPRGPASRWVTLGRVCLRCWHLEPQIPPE